MIIPKRGAQLVQRMDAALASAVRGKSLHEQYEYGVFLVISSTPSVKPFQWQYQVSEAIFDVATRGYVAKSNTQTHTAYSISEAGNGPTVAYGVIVANLPAGFQPVKIPNGTPVFCVPQKDTDGQFFYLIINTQAIDGACP